jgi:hypothetical protein
MHYPHTVTFQAPTQAQLPSGQMSPSGWTDVEDLTDLPARFIPVTIGSRTTGGYQEQWTERMLVQEEVFTIVLQGDREVERDMRAVTDYLDMTLGVVRVQRPVLGMSPLTNTTIVAAERVSAESPES